MSAPNIKPPFLSALPGTSNGSLGSATFPSFSISFSTIAETSACCLITDFQTNAADQTGLPVSPAGETVDDVGLPWSRFLNGLRGANTDAGIAADAKVFLYRGGLLQGGLRQEAGQADPGTEFRGNQKAVSAHRPQSGQHCRMLVGKEGSYKPLVGNKIGCRTQRDRLIPIFGKEGSHVVDGPVQPAVDISCVGAEDLAGLSRATTAL
jgi:hypothetical protein